MGKCRRLKIKRPVGRERARASRRRVRESVRVTFHSNARWRGVDVLVLVRREKATTARTNERILLAVETTRCSDHGKRSRVGSRGRRRRTQIILYEPIKEGKEEVFENVLFSLGVQSDRVRVRKLSDIDVYH